MSEEEVAFSWKDSEKESKIKHSIGKLKDPTNVEKLMGDV